MEIRLEEAPSTTPDLQTLEQAPNSNLHGSENNPLVIEPENKQVESTVMEEEISTQENQPTESSEVY